MGGRGVPEPNHNQVDLPGGRCLRVYGSPWTEQFGNWAFQYPPICSVWHESIPPDADIVLTHGPPRGFLDQDGKGCPQLTREVWRAKPRPVVFGNIHEGHGQEDDVRYDGVGGLYRGVVAREGGLGRCWLCGSGCGML